MEMTVQEACDVLGVPPGASAEAIKAAHREQVKRYHPDLHADGNGDLSLFQRVQEAYETLSKRNGVERRDSDGERAEDAAEGGVPDPVRIVRAIMEERGVEILFDGSMRRRTDPRMAMSQAEVEACLSSEDIDAHWLLDEILLDTRTWNSNLRKPDVERALRRVTREDRKQRRASIVRPLLAEITPSARVRADGEWLRLTSAVFVADTMLAAAVLKHFIWQVKQKILGRPVKHHLVPVIFSPEQGSGKTTFVMRFLGPLQELAAGPVLLSDVGDKRSGDIFRFPVLFLDDMEKIDPRLIPVLKSLVTSESIRRRRLGASISTTIRQRTTLIGTANTEIDDLVADETGNRRFATLRFRNGEAAKGGDPGVWDAVVQADYEFLWRSVDAFGPSPIEPHLSDLFAHQAAGRSLSDLEAWLIELDVSCDAVQGITTREGVKAKALWELFRAETGSAMTLSRFGTEMNRLVVSPAVPLSDKIKTMHGTFYPLKAPRP